MSETYLKHEWKQKICSGGRLALRVTNAVAQFSVNTQWDQQVTGKGRCFKLKDSGLEPEHFWMKNPGFSNNWQNEANKKHFSYSFTGLLCMNSAMAFLRLWLLMHHLQMFKRNSSTFWGTYLFSRSENRTISMAAFNKEAKIGHGSYLSIKTGSRRNELIQLCSES